MDNVCKQVIIIIIIIIIIIRIYFASVFICLVSLFTQENILFVFDILELDFKTSRQVGALSIVSLFLFFCCFLYIRFFVCLSLRKWKPYCIFADVIVNKATIGSGVGITQRWNSKWPSCDVLILNFTILLIRRKNGISLVQFLEIKSILWPWGSLAVSNISLVYTEIPGKDYRHLRTKTIEGFRNTFYPTWQQIFTVVTLILMENERDLSIFNSGNIGFSLLKHLISLSSGYRFSSVAAYQLKFYLLHLFRPVD